MATIWSIIIFALLRLDVSFAGENCDCFFGNLWITDNCRSGFTCDQDGGVATMTCPRGEILVPDLAAGTLACQPLDSGFVCPGEFSYDCEETYRIDCHCEGEIWVDADCTQGFRLSCH